MKIFFLKVTFLLITLFILDNIIAYFISSIAKSNAPDKRIEAFLNKEINPDCLVMGSSRAVTGISAQTISKITGLNCYNFGYGGSNVDFHHTLLNILIRNKTAPDIIILSIDDDKQLVENSSINFRMDVINPYVDYNIIDSIVCSRKNKNNLLTKASKIYRQNINISEVFNKFLKNKPDSFQVFLPDGSSPLMVKSTQKLSFFESNRVYDERQESETLRQKFIDFTKDCDKHNIQLIFLFTPQLYTSTKGFLNRIKDLTDNKYIYLDFRNNYMETSYFHDGVHLNPDGYKLFSEILASKIDSIIKINSL